MKYVHTFESYSFSGSINEATEDSIKNLQDRIAQLQNTGKTLAAKDWKALLDKKKTSVETAKEKKDNLRVQIAEREYSLVELRQQKAMLRQEMIKKEIVFLQSKIQYQTESLSITKEIDKIKSSK